MSPGGDATFEEAFAELVLPAFRVALRILGNVADAEDVAAEAMARALRSWGRVNEMPHRTAWVVRVASNLRSTAPGSVRPFWPPRTMSPTRPRPSPCGWRWVPPSGSFPAARVRWWTSGTSAA